MTAAMGVRNAVHSDVCESLQYASHKHQCCMSSEVDVVVLRLHRERKASGFFGRGICKSIPRLFVSISPTIHISWLWVKLSEKLEQGGTKKTFPCGV